MPLLSMLPHFSRQPCTHGLSRHFFARKHPTDPDTVGDKPLTDLQALIALHVSAADALH